MCVRFRPGWGWRADHTKPQAYIKLVLPVFHIGYFRHCLGILQCICKVRLAFAF